MSGKQGSMFIGGRGRNIWCPCRGNCIHFGPTFSVKVTCLQSSTSASSLPQRAGWSDQQTWTCQWCSPLNQLSNTTSVTEECCDAHTMSANYPVVTHRCFLCFNCGLLLLWHRGVPACVSTHTRSVQQRQLFACHYNKTHTYRAIGLATRSTNMGAKCAAVWCAVSHAANFHRPDLDLPRGFSCYWRNAQPSCRLHVSHTSNDIGCDNHLFHEKRETCQTHDVLRGQQ